MRRSSIAVISLVIVVLLGGTAYGYMANQRSWWPFGNASPITALTNPLGRFVDLVPPEAVIYGHFDLNNAANIATVMATPQLSASVQTIKQGWSKLITQVESEQPVPAEAKALLELIGTHEVEVALIPKDISGNATKFADTTSIIAALTLKAGEDANQQMVAIKGGIKSGLKSNQDMVNTDSTVGAHTVTAIKITDKNDPSAPAQELFLTNLQNQLLVMTSDSGAMTQILNNSDSNNHASLSNQTSYPRLHSQLSSDQLITIYTNGEKQLQWQEALNKTLGVEQEPMMEEFNKKMQTALAGSNLLKYQAIIGINFTPKGLMMSGFTSFSNPETAKVYSNSNLVYNTLVPENALMYAEMHNITAPTALLAPLVQAIDESLSVAMNERTTVVAQIEQATGLSVANDLAPLFQENSAFAIIPHPLSMAPISISLLTQVSDTAKAQATMEKVTAALMQSFNAGLDDADAEKVNQQTIGSATINSFGQLMPGDYIFNYTIRAKDLFVSSSLEALKGLLAPTKPLASSAVYPSFLKQAGQVNGTTFINVRGIVELVKPIMLDQLSMSAMDFSDPEADFEAQEQLARTQIETEVMPYLNIIRNISAFSRQEGELVRSDVLVQMVD